MVAKNQRLLSEAKTNLWPIPTLFSWATQALKCIGAHMVLGLTCGLNLLAGAALLRSQFCWGKAHAGWCKPDINSRLSMENDIAVLFQSKWNVFDKITSAWQSTFKLCKGKKRRGKSCINSKTIQLYLISPTYCCLSVCVFYWQNKINWISSHTITCSFLPHTNCLANWCLLNFLHFIEWLGTKLTVDICRRLTGVCNYC